MDVVLDLSHPIGPGMSLWPGTPKPEFRQLRNHRRHGYEERRYTLTSHLGTHLDAPSHMAPGGPSLDRMSLDRFTGLIRVVDVRACAGREIFANDLTLAPACGEPGGFLLLWTGWAERWGRPDYAGGYPALSREAAEQLARAGWKGLGVDAFSADLPGSKDYPVHRILLPAGVLIVENLTNLDALFAHLHASGRSCRFAAFPLPFPEADGCPVRAVALG